MSHTTLIPGAVLGACLLALPAMAQKAEMRAADIIGASVTNSRDVEIGTVDDLILTDQNRVTAATLSVGGFLGIGEKIVAVPFSDLDIREDGTVFFATTREGLEQLPAYEDGQWAALWKEMTGSAAQTADEVQATAAETRTEYEAKMRQTLSDWEMKLDQAKAESGEMADDAGAEVNEAWASLQDQWSKLQDASGDAWEDTKQSVDEGMERLQDAWDELASDS